PVRSGKRRQPGDGCRAPIWLVEEWAEIGVASQVFDTWHKLPAGASYRPIDRPVVAAGDRARSVEAEEAGDDDIELIEMVKQRLPRGWVIGDVETPALEGRAGFGWLDPRNGKPTKDSDEHENSPTRNRHAGGPHSLEMRVCGKPKMFLSSSIGRSEQAKQREGRKDAVDSQALLERARMPRGS